MHVYSALQSTQAYAYMGIDWYTRRSACNLSAGCSAVSAKQHLQFPKSQVQKKRQNFSLLFFIEELYYWYPGRKLCQFQVCAGELVSFVWWFKLLCTRCYATYIAGYPAVTQVGGVRTAPPVCALKPPPRS